MASSWGTSWASSWGSSWDGAGPPPVCDYPAVGNVRLGVVYANGGMVGTLVLPAVGKVVYGTPYGTGGTELTGNVTLPPEGDVLRGYQYGALGTQFTGTLAAPTPRPAPNTVAYANQGVDPYTVVVALRNLLGLALDFQASADGTYRDVVYWEHPSKVQDTGRQTQVWFKLAENAISPSPGPGRFGNRADIKFQVSLVTRAFTDGTQRDIRKAVAHYERRLKLEDTLQGKQLFYVYQSQPVDPPIWTPPQPAADEVPLTVAPMLIESAPGPIKTQKEEGTNETAYLVSVPCVLLLTLPTADDDA